MFKQVIFMALFFQVISLESSQRGIIPLTEDNVQYNGRSFFEIERKAKLNRLFKKVEKNRKHSHQSAKRNADKKSALKISSTQPVSPPFGT